MRAILISAVGVLMGCGGAAGIASAPMDTLATTESPGEEFAQAEPAPWNISHMSEADVHPELVEAWRTAENHEWCGLMTFDGSDESTPQISSFEGGWAAEFEEGETASFGIMGSAIDPDAEDPAEAEERRYRDGSVLRFEAGLTDEDPARVATIRVAGQGCVYQVWSFVDDAHLEMLISGLRRVEGTTSANGEGQAHAATRD